MPAPGATGEDSDEHAAIVNAVLSGDSELAVKLLAAHYQKTADVILQDETIFPELKRVEQAAP